MRILTGDECGLLKETIPEIGRAHVDDTFGPTNATTTPPITVEKGIQRINTTEYQSRSRGIIDMVWTKQEEESTQFATLRNDSSIDIYNIIADEEHKPGNYECCQSIEHIFNHQKEEEVKKEQYDLVGLGYSKHYNKLCVVNSLGTVSILDPTKDDDDDDNATIVANYSAYRNGNTNSKISYTKGGYENKQQATAMAMTSSSADNTTTTAMIAVGGREREITVFNINDGGKSIWKAKNLPPDPQTLLQQPVWPTALCFLSANHNSNSNLLVAGTAYQEVRLYDIRTQRRPLFLSPDNIFEHRITSICQLSDNTLAVGDTTGGLLELDIRMQLGPNSKRKGSLTSLPRFIGPVGSIRRLARHETEPILIVVGYDRMLRTYHLQTRNQLDCVYLKQRLNCALICQDKQFHIDEIITSSGKDEVHDYVDSSEEEEEPISFSTTTKFVEKVSNSSSDDDDAESIDVASNSSNDDDDDDDDDSQSYESSFSGGDDESSDDDDDESPAASQPKEKKQRSR